ncbi:MAG: hypothetical protein AAGL49_08170 [Pseudomonadota bacterium]
MGPIFRTGGAIVAAILMALAGFYAYVGGFSKPETRIATFEPAEIVYGTHKGSYSNLSESWSAFEETLTAAGLAQCDALAVYLDPPGTPEDELRTVIACRIDRLDADTRASLMAAAPHTTLPGAEAYAADFPFKNAASYFIGAMKVYPEFEKTIEASAHEPPIAIEVYGLQGETDTIEYYMPFGVDRSTYAELFGAFG